MQSVNHATSVSAPVFHLQGSVRQVDVVRYEKKNNDTIGAIEYTLRSFYSISGLVKVGYETYLRPHSCRHRHEISVPVTVPAWICVALEGAVIPSCIGRNELVSLRYYFMHRPIFIPLSLRITAQNSAETHHTPTRDPVLHTDMI